MAAVADTRIPLFECIMVTVQLVKYRSTGYTELLSNGSGSSCFSARHHINHMTLVAITGSVATDEIF